MEQYGYSLDSIRNLEKEVTDFVKIRNVIRMASGDYVDLKAYDPDMRHLIDTYLSASPSRILTSFDGKPLAGLLADIGLGAIKDMPFGTRAQKEAAAEIIENNVGKEIVEKTQTNPKYYEKMSALLEGLIEQRKKDVLEYEKYLQKIVELCRKVHRPEAGMDYPENIRNSAAKRAFYDYSGGNAELAEKLHEAVLASRQDCFRGNKVKERKIKRAIEAVIKDKGQAEELLALVRGQREY